MSRYIGKYFVEMHGEVDAIVFTGGIGENSVQIRRRISSQLQCLSLYLDQDRNQSMINDARGIITTDQSKLQAYVIPTNEELMIARDTVKAINMKG